MALIRDLMTSAVLIAASLTAQDDTISAQPSGRAENAPSNGGYLVRIVKMGMGDAIYTEPAVLKSSHFNHGHPLDVRNQLDALCVQGSGYAEELDVYHFPPEVVAASAAMEVHLDETLASVTLRRVKAVADVHELIVELAPRNNDKVPAARKKARVRSGHTIGVLFPYRSASSDRYPNRILAVVIAPLTPHAPSIPVLASYRLALGCGGMGLHSPKAVEMHFPVCPDAATTAACSARFVFEITVDERGVPRDPRLLWVRGGSEDLLEEALEAVSKWRFIPAISGNNTYEVLHQVTVDVRN